MVVREFLTWIQRLVREGGLPRPIGDRLRALLRARREDVMVVLEQYPSLLTLGKGGIDPIGAETGNGILVVRKQAVPCLGLFRSSVEHRQLVNLLSLLKERLFWGSYTLSPRSILDRQEVKKQFAPDFQKLSDHKFREAQDRVEARLTEFVALEFKIEEYLVRVGFIVRDFAIGAEHVFEVFFEGLGRLSEIGDETRKAIGQCCGASLNIVGMIYHLSALYASVEIYRADQLAYSLMKALQQYAQIPAKPR